MHELTNHMYLQLEKKQSNAIYKQVEETKLNFKMPACPPISILVQSCGCFM